MLVYGTNCSIVAVSQRYFDIEDIISPISTMFQRLETLELNLTIEVSVTVESGVHDILSHLPSLKSFSAKQCILNDDPHERRGGLDQLTLKEFHLDAV